MAPLHSSLGNKSKTQSQKKNKTKPKTERYIRTEPGSMFERKGLEACHMISNYRKRRVNICCLSKMLPHLHTGALIIPEALEKSAFIFIKQMSRQELKELNNIS